MRTTNTLEEISETSDGGRTARSLRTHSQGRDSSERAALIPSASFKAGKLTSRVKVILHVCNSETHVASGGILDIDKRRKQVSLLSPDTVTLQLPAESIDSNEKKQAPRLFAFDGLYTDENTEHEMVDGLSSDILTTVVDGHDGCVVSLGSSSRAKDMATFGSRAFNKFGTLPSCIHKLFERIQAKKAQGSRFSVRVSAAQLMVKCGRETLSDLLFPYAKDGDQAPGYFLSGHRGLSEITRNPDSVLECLSQIRTIDADTACAYVNVARITAESEPGSHFIFTLHLYQCTVDSQSRKVVGGRSRLHFIKHGGRNPSITTFGGMLSAILNDQRHLPSRWNKMGTLLRECLGSFQCQSVVIVHVSKDREHYAETLASLQLGSRIHRLRRHRGLKYLNMKLRNRSLTSADTHANDSNNQSGNGKRTSSDPSSSEQSCDTVIYLGPSTDDGTDGEHPPLYRPSSPASLPIKKPQRARSGTPQIPQQKLFGMMEDSRQTMKSPINCPSEKYNAIDFLNPVESRDERWIDGPSIQQADLNANNVFCTRASEHIRPYNATLMTKAHLVRHWIADQMRRSAIEETIQQYPRYLQNAINHQWILEPPCASLPFDYSSFRGPPVFHPDYSQRTQYRQLEPSEFQYEIVEVIEPAVPVSTKDAAVQVSSEDIKQTYNDLRASNLSRAHEKLLHLSSSYASEAIKRYLKIGNVGTSITTFSNESDWILESPWNHPLRVLSQECLTVVSTFADSTSVKSDTTTLRLSPPRDRYRVTS